MRAIFISLFNVSSLEPYDLLRGSYNIVGTNVPIYRKKCSHLGRIFSLSFFTLEYKKCSHLKRISSLNLFLTQIFQLRVGGVGEIFSFLEKHKKYSHLKRISSLQLPVEGGRPWWNIFVSCITQEIFASEENFFFKSLSYLNRPVKGGLGEIFSFIA